MQNLQMQIRKKKPCSCLTSCRCALRNLTGRAGERGAETAERWALFERGLCLGSEVQGQPGAVRRGGRATAGARSPLLPVSRDALTAGEPPRRGILSRRFVCLLNRETTEYHSCHGDWV